MLLTIIVGFIAFDMLSAVAIAQDIATNTPPDAGNVPALDIFKQLKPVEFLLIPLVTVVIQGARKFIPQIPDAVWPWVAPFIGAILDYTASKAGLWTGNAAVGAMLGGLGTWFHQLDKNSVNVLEKIMPTSGKK